MERKTRFKTTMENKIMINVLCINGAPGVGKDTAGKLLKETHGNARIMKFASPLDDIARNLLPMKKETFDHWREFKKEKPLTDFGCSVTLRQLLIRISENLIKPCFGNTYFAEVAALTVMAQGREDQLIVITDSGFQYEFDHFKEMLDGVANVRLIHMTRNGHTFDGDSRHAVNDGDNTVYLNNDGSLDELRSLLSLELF